MAVRTPTATFLAPSSIRDPAALLQRPQDADAQGQSKTDVIILTHETVEGRMNKAISQMQSLPTVLAPIVRIRKEELS